MAPPLGTQSPAWAHAAIRGDLIQVRFCKCFPGMQPLSLPQIAAVLAHVAAIGWHSAETYVLEMVYLRISRGRVEFTSGGSLSSCGTGLGPRSRLDKASAECPAAPRSPSCKGTLDAETRFILIQVRASHTMHVPLNTRSTIMGVEGASMDLWEQHLLGELC